MGDTQRDVSPDDPGQPGRLTPEEEEAIHARFADKPSLETLLARGEIDRDTYDAAKRQREMGPPGSLR